MVLVQFGPRASVLPNGLRASGLSENDKRLLVVDDEPDFCHFVEIVARQLNYRVTKIVDSRRFKEAYHRCRPDVIVLDMVMPEPTGLDLISWMVEEGCEAKILIVTGYNPHTAKAAHLQSVARGHLRVKTFTKPVSVRKLRAALS